MQADLPQQPGIVDTDVGPHLFDVETTLGPPAEAPEFVEFPVPVGYGTLDEGAGDPLEPPVLAGRLEGERSGGEALVEVGRMVVMTLMGDAGKLDAGSDAADPEVAVGH